nr:uncharacterized protein LOC100174996 [Ciona intestinalis]|eukprot:XP_002119695.1 uncharacterized protein LOC100174996 [Ciona intestinalis]
MQVVICVDESKTAEAVFNWYFDNLHKQGNDVTVVHVADQPQIPTLVCYEKAVFPIDEFQRRVEKCKKKMADIKSKFSELAQQKNTQCNFKIQLSDGGPAGEVIVALTKEYDISMVVLGTRGQGVVRRTILGSVSDYVVHHANVPVLIYRG